MMRWISPPLMMIKVLLYSLGFRNWNLNIFRNGQTRVGIWESKCPAGELLHDNSVTVTYEQFFQIVCAALPVLEYPFVKIFRIKRETSSVESPGVEQVMAVKQKFCSHAFE